MLKRLLCSLLTLLVLAPGAEVFAQDDSAEQQKQLGLYKMLAGAGLLAIGGYMAGTSSESVTISTPFAPPTTLSARRNGRLVVGLVLAGGGGFLLWDGSKDRREAQQPTSSLNLGLAPGGAGLTFSRHW